jgi:nitrile hydratase accessory protein
VTPELDVDGPAAPPRRNGELAFEHPWQGRLFAVTMALCDAGALEYEQFRARLIAAVARRDATATGADSGSGSPDEYWAAWQEALEALAFAGGLTDEAELARRARAFAQHA